jgi:hypothetical protein
MRSIAPVFSTIHPNMVLRDTSKHHVGALQNGPVHIVALNGEVFNLVECLAA